MCIGYFNVNTSNEQLHKRLLDTYISIIQFILLNLLNFGINTFRSSKQNDSLFRRSSKSTSTIYVEIDMQLQLT